jgi:hypothetical protein
MSEAYRLTGLGSIPRAPKSPKHLCESLQTRQLEHAIEMDEKKLDIEQAEQKRHWKSCCWDLHADSTIFFSKLFVSLVIIGLCIYQLITLEDCGSQHMYSGILGIILGFWLRA